MSQILLSSYPAAFPNEFSLDFNGSSQYITLPGAAVDINTAFTIEGWYKLATDGNNSLFSAQASGTDYWIFIARNDGNGLCFQKQADPEDPSGVFICAGAATISVSNGWCHGAVTFDGVDDWNILKNGAVIKNQTYSPTGVLPLTNQQIAALNGGVFFDGNMDEVRVWDVERTPAQVLANMSRNLVPADNPNLTGYWRFEEGSGSTAVDETTNNDGTEVGTPTYSTDVPY